MRNIYILIRSKWWLYDYLDVARGEVYCWDHYYGTYGTVYLHEVQDLRFIRPATPVYRLCEEDVH